MINNKNGDNIIMNAYSNFVDIFYNIIIIIIIIIYCAINYLVLCVFVFFWFLHCHIITIVSFWFLQCTENAIDWDSVNEKNINDNIIYNILLSALTYDILMVSKKGRRKSLYTDDYTFYRHVIVVCIVLSLYIFFYTFVCNYYYCTDYNFAFGTVTIGRFSSHRFWT